MPRRRAKRVIIGLLLSIVLIGAALAYTAWRLSWQQPSWYAPPNPTDDRVVRLADDAEYDLLQKTQQIRPEEERWTLRLTAEQINAWLAARLPAWIEHDANLRWPKEIGTPQVLIDQGEVRVAVPVTALEGVTRTVVATVAPFITDESRLSIRLTSIALGKVWVPGEPLSKLVDAVKDAAPEFVSDARVQQAIDVLAGQQSLPAEFVLADGRRVSIKDIKIAAGALEMTAVTLP